MAWIEMHQALIAHPKTKRLARRIGAQVPAAIGYLACLWCWCIEYAQDGDLGAFEPEEIADAAMYQGDASAFVAALVEAGFLDQGESLTVHDWHDYAGRLVERRAANTKRMRDARAKNVQNTCDARAGATVPNPTVPNQTQQDPPQPPGGGGVVASGELEVDPAPEPLPFEDDPIRDPGEGDDILEARIPALVQVSSGVPDAEKPEVHQVSASFDAFWKLRKWSGDKPVAYKRWVTAGLDVDEAKREVAMAAVAAQIADRAKAATLGVWYADWKHAEGWISGQRWNDPLKCDAGPVTGPPPPGPAQDPLAKYAW